MEKKPQFIRSISRRNKPIFVEDNLYIYNFIHTIGKGEIELYKCKEYKSEFRCEAFIHIKNNTDIVIKFKNKHNHRTI